MIEQSDRLAVKLLAGQSAAEIVGVNGRRANAAKQIVESASLSYARPAKEGV